jgi:hypothetical protein
MLLKGSSSVGPEILLLSSFLYFSFSLKDKMIQLAEPGSSLNTHSLKFKGDSTPFPDPPDMVRRQQKIIARYYSYQLTAIG